MYGRMIFLFDCSLRFVSLFVGCVVLLTKFLGYAFSSSILKKQASYWLLSPTLRANQFNASSDAKHKARRTLTMGKNIVMLPAEKERMTVILDKTDYIEKTKQLLIDTTIYRLLDTDPTAKLENVNNTLAKLHDMQRTTTEKC